MVTHWVSWQRSLATVLWTSFLAACLATALFFAVISPTNLLSSTSWATELSDTAVYSIGFFFFWGIAAFATALNTLMIRTERRRGEFPADLSSK